MTGPRSFSIVVAADAAFGIGLNGTLPWRLRKDMAFFAMITSKVILSTPSDITSPTEAAAMASLKKNLVSANACIMGRKTWESIPKKFRPLNSRLNIIVSRNPTYLDNDPESKANPLVRLVGSLDDALELVEKINQRAHSTIIGATTDAGVNGGFEETFINIPRTFLIGGAQLYTEGVRSANCENIFLTRIQQRVECDTYFPTIKATDYQLLESNRAHDFLERFVQEPVEAGVIEEGEFKYEYTVYQHK